MAAATSDGKSSARRNAWPIRETSSSRGNLARGFAALARRPERPFMAGEHATKDRRGTLLRLRVRAAETDEPFRAVLTGRQRAEMRPHVPQVAADGMTRWNTEAHFASWL